MLQDKQWINRTNIYEVNLRQYTQDGTFQAFGLHLPRLKEMGVETLWFMPITPISQKEKKGTMGSYYASSDYLSINPEFGTLEDFRLLVSQIHGMGMKVIIDWVANHTGWDHVWVKEHPEWYEKDPQTGTFKRASGMDDILELDFTNVQMRQAMIDAMKFWVMECNIDGFRCDLAFWVELDFWLEAVPKVNEMKSLFWLAESDPIDHPEYMKVFDAAYTWRWMHQTEAFAKKQISLSDLIRILSRYQQAPGIKSWFTSNHDENSWNGTEYEKYGGAALPLAVFSCTWQGIPLMYSGQELPNQKRLKFFDKDVIEWTGHFGLHDFYKTLLNLHHTNPACSASSELYPVHTSADDQVLGYLRKAKDHEVLVLINLCNREVRFDIKSGWISGSFIEIFTGANRNLSSDRHFEMEAWKYLIWVKD